MEHLVSAGGVVCRVGEGAVEVVLCGRGTPTSWSLPKGTPEKGEIREVTAVREVVEETGLEVAIEGFIGNIEYRFVRQTDGVDCVKVVYYFLMSVAGGEFSNHDSEFDKVQWFAADAAAEAMKYGNEAKMVERGVSMVSRRENTP